MIPGFLTSLLLQSLLWIAKQAISLGWQAGKQVLRLPPAALGAILATGLLAGITSPAHAGWFTRQPDPLTQAANDALERAASIANQAASQQADQNIRVAEAISSLSAERMQMANLLAEFGRHTSRDSAWSAALLTLGPVAIVIAILVVGGLALFMAMKDDLPPYPDAESLLLDESIGTDKWFKRQGLHDNHPDTNSRLASLLDGEQRAAIEADPSPTEEMPF